MKTRGNLVTERAGVNYARTIVESAGSFFKEINLQHDVGQDATIVLVVDGVVRPREIALQIKSGDSYVTTDHCRIPAKSAHIYYWANHDLLTIGVVYDPGEASAYWIDLQAASRHHRQSTPKTGTTFTFAKSAWNRFDAVQFSNILVPTLLGEAPIIPLNTLCEWINDTDPETHGLGARVLRARHRDKAPAWKCLLEAYRNRPLEQLTIDTPISFAMLLGHDDIGYHSGDIPNDVRRSAVSAVLKFGADEIAKALALLPECDFQRPSLGYSLMPLWGMTKDSLSVLRQIADEERYGDEVRERATLLLAWHRHDPDEWRFWRRDDPERHW
ncbi:DUF4365 domain-containing protein [Methylobacterium sp. CM6241]